MHLAELIRWRTTPGAGLLLALTERCPLSCAHCSTSSTMQSAEHSDEPVRKLIDSLRPDDRPELILMSGGEPLLRPDLVADLASRAHSAGTRSSLLSGMFFARHRTPPPIRRAIASLDHFSASIDVFHEREVSRTQVFAALTEILDLVPAVSLHVTATDNAYLDDLLPQVRRAFGTRIPILVNRLQPRGRARSLPHHPPTPASRTPQPNPAAPPPGSVSRSGMSGPPAAAQITDPSAASSPVGEAQIVDPAASLRHGLVVLPAPKVSGNEGFNPDPGPCEFAAWPLVDYDGTVFACSRQSLVRQHRSEHLILGHAAADSWPVLRARMRSDPVLRSVRALGAVETARRNGTPVCSGACETCVTLAPHAELPPAVEAVAHQLLTRLRPRDLARRWGAGPYADLVELGWAPCAD